MATLIELLDAGQISQIDPALGLQQQQFRRIFVLPDLQKWLEENLPNLGSTWKIEQSPQEQLDALIAIYCSGDTADLSMAIQATQSPRRRNLGDENSGPESFWMVSS